MPNRQPEISSERQLPEITDVPYAIGAPEQAMESKRDE